MADATSPGALHWHALPPEEVLRRVESGPQGLSEDEARRRRERFGPNALEVHRPTPAWVVLVAQVKSVMVALLAVAALVSLALGEPLEAGAIAVVIAANVVIGFWTELGARRSMESLRTLEVQGAEVVRGGARRRIDARELVPGDVIAIEAGEAIPADARLLAGTELSTVEAPLTGESLPVVKSAAAVDAGAPLAERTSMVHKGTLAVSGGGRAVVVATGACTEIGRVGQLVQETAEERTPLEARLDQLGRTLVWVALAIAGIVTLLGLLRGQPAWLMVETGIALAVAAVPEGLPVVAVIALAVGMRRMARRRALVRRLAAVEALGSTTVLCTDKTGTITAGEMTVRLLWLGGRELELSGVGYAPEGELRAGGEPVDVGDVEELERALQVCVLTNRARVERGDDGWRVVGDPTEGALLVAARKAGVDPESVRRAWPEVADVPFSSERALMATFHRGSQGDLEARVKGAPEVLVGLAAEVPQAGGARPLDDSGRRALLERNLELARRGHRVLALGARRLGPSEEPGPDALRGLTLLGFAALQDPPAPGVAETVARLRGAGIRTLMITGDQRATAEAVGREVGVLAEGEEILDGAELARLDDDALSERLERVGGFSRTAPEDKLRIVRALQRRGEVVGMLGDGVNDAAALKGAQIGVAMGRRGTDVAKETSDVVLVDDAFETVAAAVEEGRVVYDDIRKFVFFLFSANLSEVLVLFAAGLAGLSTPLLPLQILWINLVTDVAPALALAVEPPEPDVLRRPPLPPTRALLSRSFLRSVASYGLLMSVAPLALFATFHADLPRARTLAFLVLGLSQVFHLINARSFGPLFLSRRLWTNPWSWGAVVLSGGLLAAAVELEPLARVLRLEAPSGREWGLVVGLAAVPAVVGQAWKALRARRPA